MRLAALVAWLVVGSWATQPARAGELEQELGRTEVRVRSAAYPIVAGRSVAQMALTERLDRLGYERVHQKPESAGQYFYGHRRFWIYRREHRWDGRDHAASLMGLELRESDGMILGAIGLDDRRHALDRVGLSWLEPETLSESLAADRADRSLIDLDDLPERVWRPLLAAEDARFFEHTGVDAKAVARATVANVKEGGVAQGGSTITQQLIKNRDLTPKRSMGRKLSEAVRALALEASHDKREILQAYLNQVYYGHVNGLAIHGIGTAARAYFSKSASRLSLAESALLAAMIQAPNRLSPVRHPEAAQERRDWVLSRMEELDWAGSAEVQRARDSEIRLHPGDPELSAPVHFMSWISHVTAGRLESRLEKGRGVVVETTLDPHLQGLAERAVRSGLNKLRRDRSRLRGAPLSAALVALDAGTGEVLAYVGGDPAATGSRFDRVRNARRQPGSTVKPLIMLEALDDCGSRQPLTPSTRIRDAPLTIELPDGPWSPENADRRYRGIVDARSALAESRNVPMIRVARWCGFDATAERFRKAGLEIPAPPPPSFVLGAVETTPLALAGAYTVFATSGRMLEPHGIRRIEKPEGRALIEIRPDKHRAAHAATAYIVRDMMRSAVARGTAGIASIEGLDVAAKTGSSSELRDAWFAGHSGSLVTVVWVGLDDAASLGLSGSAAAGPIWREFVKDAEPARPAHEQPRPRNVADAFVDPQTGLLVGEDERDARAELYRHRYRPRRNRFWRIDQALPVIE